MSKKHGRAGSGIIPSPEAIDALKGDDFPPAVKQALRLSQRGGRQRSRRCLGCGACGEFIEVYTPHDCMRPMGDEGTGIRVYWTCRGCHEQGLSSELEQKLQRCGS